MALKLVQLGDVGTIFRVTFVEAGVIVPINTATAKTIILKPLRGDAVVKAGVFTTDGLDGQLECVTVAGDLSLVGQWQVQGHVIMPAGEWHSLKHRFDVEVNLD